MADKGGSAVSVRPALKVYKGVEPLLGKHA